MFRICTIFIRINHYLLRLFSHFLLLCIIFQSQKVLLPHLFIIKKVLTFKSFVFIKNKVFLYFRLVFRKSKIQVNYSADQFITKFVFLNFGYFVILFYNL